MTLINLTITTSRNNDVFFLIGLFHKKDNFGAFSKKIITNPKVLLNKLLPEHGT
jgi:hypothetical protein